MVLAIVALVFHLNALPAVADPIEQVVPATESAQTQRASIVILPSPTKSADAQKQADQELMASATTVVTGDDFRPQASDSNASSPASFSSVIGSSESLAAIRVGTPDSKARRFTAAEATPSRRQWLTLAIAEHAAATFDAYSTREAVNRGAVEADPLMKPFAQSPAIYAVIQVAPLALDFAARRMQRSSNRFLHGTWWVPQSAATGMFLFSGVHNVHVANSLR